MKSNPTYLKDSTSLILLLEESNNGKQFTLTEQHCRIHRIEIRTVYITPNKVQGYVTDNAANMKASARSIGQTGIPRFPCLCHTFNLTVEVGAHNAGAKLVMEKCRDLAVHLHRNDAHKKIFNAWIKRY